MNKILIISFILLCNKMKAQELFVFTEPASNMPAKSLGIRVANMFKNEKLDVFNYQLMPEIMYGYSNKLMLHLQGFISNDKVKSFNGISVYGKYRFLSNDNVHSHFRMAAFGRWSTNNKAIRKQEIEVSGQNKGIELGFIATQLLHKTAISATMSLESSNKNYEAIFKPFSKEAMNYTLSFGQLILPKEYKSFKQTNLNLMCEFLAQKNLHGQHYFIDIAPSAQLIINSQARLDFGYRKQLLGNITRNSNNMVVIKLEYLFFRLAK